MTDVIRDVAAGLLEVPEEAMKEVGKALEAVGDELQRLAAAVAALEARVK